MKMPLYVLIFYWWFFLFHSGMKGNDGIIDTNDSIKNDAMPLLKCFLLFFFLMMKMDQILVFKICLSFEIIRV